MTTAPAPPAARGGGPLGPLQVVPPGLMGLLQLKQEGRLPSQLADTVVGVIELRDWFLTARRLTEIALFGSVPQVAANLFSYHIFSAGGAQCIVPANQIWYVEQMSVWVTQSGAPVASDVIRFAAAISGPNGPLQTLGPDVSDPSVATFAGGTRQHVDVARADRGFWAYPGDSLGIQVFDVVTTNGWTANLSLRATPCPI